MNRLSLFMTALLLITIGTFSYLQWTSYLKVNGGSTENMVKWEFSIVHADNVLTVKQSAKSVPEGNYTVNWPEDTLDIQCTQEEVDCNWNSENKETVELSNAPVLFSYVIPLSNKESEGTILRNWSVNLEELAAKEVTISFTQRQYRNGEWIAALKTKGKVSKDHITFYEYKGDFVSPLVFHPTPLQMTQQGTDLTIWSKDKINITSASEESLSKESIKLKPTTILVTNEVEAFESQRLFVVSSEEELINLYQKRITQWIQSKWKEDAKWQADIFISDLIGIELPNSKRKNMKVELSETLTTKQAEKLKETILSAPEKSINPETLNQFVSEIVGQQTNFFTLNANGDVPFEPFLTWKDKPLVSKGKELENISVRYYRNEPVVPFVDFLMTIGFDVTQVSEESAYILEKDGNRYRFFTNQNIFILNEEDYGLLENPLLLLGDSMYIETGWLEQFFSVTIVENETSYEIVSL